MADGSLAAKGVSGRYDTSAPAVPRLRCFRRSPGDRSAEPLAEESEVKILVGNVVRVFGGTLGRAPLQGPTGSGVGFECAYAVATPG